MLPHSSWWLVVDALAVYRLTILAGKDMVTEPLREWVRRRSHPNGPAVQASLRWRSVFDFISCPWCTGMWFAAGAVALTRLWPQGWQYVAMALALSAVAGFLGER